jgi:DNA-binding transcriptional LysR family regulator
MAVRASQGQYGKLTVGLCGPATAPFLPGLIREFKKRQPGVTVSLKDMDPARQPVALANGVIDIGFTRSVPPEFQKVLRSQIFFREPLIAALPKGHPLANEPTIQLAQLAAEPFVLYARAGAPELFDTIAGFCKKAKFSPRVVDSPDLWQTVLTLVEAGEGVSLVPACVKHLRSNGVVFRTLSDRRRLLEVVLAWRQEEPSAIRDGFLHVLRKNLPEIERLMENGQ